jgi:hypothetical protein
MHLNFEQQLDNLRAFSSLKRIRVAFISNCRMVRFAYGMVRRLRSLHVPWFQGHPEFMLLRSKLRF